MTAVIDSAVVRSSFPAALLKLFKFSRSDYLLKFEIRTKCANNGILTRHEYLGTAAAYWLWDYKGNKNVVLLFVSTFRSALE